MGFSLGRALAGALAGGATAVGQIADQQILEAQRARETEANFARQRQLMQEQDTMVGNRAERVLDTKNKYEEAKLTKISDFYKKGLAELQEEGIDPGSIQGQTRLAKIAGESGHPELIDKFLDNRFKLEQLADVKELKQAENQVRLATIGASRAASNDNRQSNRDMREEQYNQNKIEKMANITYVDREGKDHKRNAYGEFNTLFQSALENGYSGADALKAVSAAASLANRAISQKVDPEIALASALKTAATWSKPLAAETTTPPPQSEAPPAAVVKKPKPETETPGFFNRSGGNSASFVDPYANAGVGGVGAQYP